MVFRSDGKVLATGSYDYTARFWDARTGEPIGGPLRHAGVVTSVSFRPDGTVLATGSYDHTARFWDTRHGRTDRGTVAAPLDVVSALMFRDDGKILATGSWDKTTRLWDMPAPLEEDVEQLVRSVQVATGSSDADGFGATTSASLPSSV